MTPVGRRPVRRGADRLWKCWSSKTIERSLDRSGKRSNAPAGCRQVHRWNRCARSRRQGGSDLILIDLCCPGSDGQSVISTLPRGGDAQDPDHRDERRVPRRRPVEERHRRGARGFLEKP
jgi:hypothetical protein